MKWLYLIIGIQLGLLSAALVNPEWAAAFVALFLGLAGIFELENRIFRPKLKIFIKMSPPDCHPIDMKDGQGKISASVYYLRFRIENVGKKEAKDVQVMMTRLEEFNGQNFVMKDSFLPLNLTWSNIGGYSVQSIPTHTFRHCDFGYITEGSHMNMILSSFGLKSNGFKAILKTDTIVQPNTGSHIIFPGKYKLWVNVSASNADTIEKVFEINFDNRFDLITKNFIHVGVV